MMDTAQKHHRKGSTSVQWAIKILQVLCIEQNPIKSVVVPES